MVMRVSRLSVAILDMVREDAMRDDQARLEWYNCRECGELYTWFRIDVVDGLLLYGWLHWDEMVKCSRNTGLTLQDFRDNIEGSDVKPDETDHSGQGSDE